MSYKKIGPTAYEVASQRALSNIKYAKEIFKEIGGYIDSATPEELAYLKEASMHNIAPMFESRYKLTDKIINQSGIRQILELASGLSPRGLSYADDPTFTFVETDLPEMIEEKRRIVNNIVGERKNLYLEEADALNLDSLLVAARHFKPSPIVIVAEGLLRYLNFDQKASVAKNVHAILEKFGGFWVTPDIAIAAPSHYDKEHGHQVGVLKMSGIDLEKNKFESTQSGQIFMEDLGFTVQRVPLLEVLDELETTKVLQWSTDKVKELLNGRETFVMKIA